MDVSQTNLMDVNLKKIAFTQMLSLSQMLSLWMLSVVLLGASTASPFTNQQASFTDEDEAAFEERKEVALEEVESRERALEEELLDTLLEEERLLDTELTSSDSAKFITNSNVEGEKFFKIVEMRSTWEIGECSLQKCTQLFDRLRLRLEKDLLSVYTARCRQAPFNSLLNSNHHSNTECGETFIVGLHRTIQFKSHSRFNFINFY